MPARRGSWPFCPVPSGSCGRGAPGAWRLRGSWSADRVPGRFSLRDPQIIRDERPLCARCLVQRRGPGRGTPDPGDDMPPTRLAVIWDVSFSAGCSTRYEKSSAVAARERSRAGSDKASAVVASAKVHRGPRLPTQGTSWSTFAPRRPTAAAVDVPKGRRFPPWPPRRPSAARNLARKATEQASGILRWRDLLLASSIWVGPRKGLPTGE
jgi:hypothetical protein